MTDHHGPVHPARPRAAGPWWRVWALMASLFAVGGLWLVACGGSNGDQTSTEAPGTTTTTTIPATPTTTTLAPSTVAPEPSTTTTTTSPAALPTGIRPERVVIPSIGVDAPTVTLDLGGSEPEVPDDFADAGWYEQTRLPGEIGPAVIAGHIDSKTGPAVFYRLDQLRAGDQITVRGGAGASRTFSVVGSGQYLKDQLPPEVFAFGEAAPELRLITCGGAFDRSSGHYRDNYVVYARAVA